MISTGKWSRSGLSLAFSFLQFRGLNPSRFSRIWLVKSGEIQTFPTEVGQVVTFLPPYVVHDRVAHDYLKDFQSEADLQKLGLRGLKSGDCMWLFSGGFVIFFPTGMVTIGDFIVSDGDLMVTWCVFCWMLRDAFVVIIDLQSCFAIFGWLLRIWGWTCLETCLIYVWVDIPHVVSKTCGNQQHGSLALNDINHENENQYGPVLDIKNGNGIGTYRNNFWSNLWFGWGRNEVALHHFQTSWCFGCGLAVGSQRRQWVKLVFDEKIWRKPLSLGMLIVVDCVGVGRHLWVAFFTSTIVVALGLPWEIGKQQGDSERPTKQDSQHWWHAPRTVVRMRKDSICCQDMPEP